MNAALEFLELLDGEWYSRETLVIVRDRVDAMIAKIDLQRTYVPDYGHFFMLSHAGKLAGTVYMRVYPSGGVVLPSACEDDIVLGVTRAGSLVRFGPAPNRRYVRVTNFTDRTEVRA